jgi:serine protease Do
MNRNRWLVLGLCLAVGTAGVFTQSNAQPPREQPAPVTKQSSQEFRKVVKQTLPAVVSIRTDTKPKAGDAEKKRRGPRSSRPRGGGDLPEEFRKQLEEMFGGELPDMENMPTPRVQGFGSGVIISADGYVLTNNHVVEGADVVIVETQDGKSFRSTDVKRDPKTDIAIVKLDVKDKTLPYAQLGDSNTAEIGDWVLAMGAPYALRGTVTAGIISAKGRTIPLGQNEGRLLYQDFIQTDAAINPGNSGGPLVDLDGKIIGINTAIETRTGSFAGIGYAVPTSIIGKVVDQLVKYGKVKRSYLGVRMGEIDSEVAERLGVKGGLMIGTVFENTPAAKAGLKETDVIKSVNGKPATEVKTLQTEIAEAAPGTTLNVTILRDGKEKSVAVKLEEQPDEYGSEVAARRTPRNRNAQAGIEVPSLGLTVVERPQGILIAKINADGVAADELNEGAYITHVEGKEVKTLAEFKKLMEAADVKEKGVLLTVRSPDGGTRMLVLKGSK